MLLPILAFLAQTGFHKIVSEHLTLTDAVRHKDLPLRVSFPREPSRYPVIVLSHGFRGSRDGLQPLASHWAEHGYVVIQPTHEDSAIYATAGNLTKADFSTWKSRVDDVTFVISSLQDIVRMVSGLKGKMDTSRIAVAGHSFGAHTAELVGGTTMLRRTFSDPRPLAFVLLSPQGVGGAFTRHSWDSFTRPMLTVTGSKDVTPTILRGAAKVTPESRRDPFLLSPPGDKYLLWMEGAEHDLGGISQSIGRNTPEREHQLAAVLWTTTTFLDAYVKGEASAKHRLGADLKGQFGGIATLSSR